ncbi:MAG: hypothetical protein J3K34DRAFT_430198 [Monoraphidium minutum]|nr:MAG: hypothetical protein J3K34DRAFT_430198 [Monoraphidium minutum]
MSFRSRLVVLLVVLLAAAPARAAAPASRALLADSGSPAQPRGWTCVELDMPPRLQWDQYSGYCGETSLQMAALYYGAWISQAAARAAGGSPQDGGQLLLPLDASKADVAGIGRNLVMAAESLKLKVSRFASASGGRQSGAALQWAKGHVVAGRPVILGVYISRCGDGCWDRYDHIIPATGYCTQAPPLDGGAAPRDADVIKLASLYSRRATWRALGGWPAAPTDADSDDACGASLGKCGCLPLGTNYAVAVWGLADANKTSLPVRLQVSSASEPNVAAGRRPGLLTGAATARGLEAGRRYRLLRYDAPAGVPTAGGRDAFLNSKYDSSLDFVAAGPEFKWKDPRKIESNGFAYYRCVPLP